MEIEQDNTNGSGKSEEITITELEENHFAITAAKHALLGRILTDKQLSKKVVKRNDQKRLG